MSLPKLCYFSEAYTISKNKRKNEVNLSNLIWGAKSDLKNPAAFGSLGFPKKSDLASLKLDVKKLNTDKLKAVSVDLSKFSNVGKK